MVPSRLKGVYERDWTKGSIARNLLLLSWPVVISGVSHIVGPTIDMVWVGRLGPAAIAAVGVAGTIVMTATIGMWGLGTGTRALIARLVGAGDTSGARHVAQQAFIISGVYAVVVTTIGLFFSEALMGSFGLEADVAAKGAGYLRIVFVGSMAMSFRSMTEAVMEASGDTRTPMKIALVYRLAHVVVGPFLIFGWWVFPRMGVNGAATANVISQSLGMALGLLVLFSGRSRLRLTLSGLRVDPHTIWRITKIGIPASLMGIQWALGGIVFIWFMIPFGTLAVAAHTLIVRLEMIVVVVGMSFGKAAGVLTGQNLGARQPERAEKSGWLAVGLVQGITLIVSVVVLLWPESIVGVFNAEPDMVKIGSIFLRIAAAGYLVNGIEGVLTECLGGAGDTVPPLLISLGEVWVVRLPLAFLLPTVAGLGVYGVRWAIVIGMFVGAVGYTVYFRGGRWKRKKV